MKRHWFRRGLRFLLFALLFVGVAGLSVMMLWNALLPAILGVSVITFWQALGLLVLSRILFGGPFRGGGFRSRTHPGRTTWKEKMTERWRNMTPEQRGQMKQEWRTNCGGGRRGRGPKPDPDQPAEPGPGTTV